MRAPAAVRRVVRRIWKRAGSCVVTRDDELYTRSSWSAGIRLHLKRPPPVSPVGLAQEASALRGVDEGINRGGLHVDRDIDALYLGGHLTLVPGGLNGRGHVYASMGLQEAADSDETNFSCQAGLAYRTWRHLVVDASFIAVQDMYRYQVSAGWFF